MQRINNVIIPIPLNDNGLRYSEYERLLQALIGFAETVGFGMAHLLPEDKQLVLNAVEAAHKQETFAKVGLYDGPDNPAA